MSLLFISMSEILNENYEDPREELRIYEKSISAEYKKFERLSKNEHVINGMKKIIDRCGKEVAEDISEGIDKEVNVGSEIKNILKEHRNLWLYVTGTLKLPLSNIKYSELSIQQKLDYLALKDALVFNRMKQITKGHREPTNAKNIMWNCNKNLQFYQKKIENKFSRYNFNNLLVLKTTLKDDFGLTENECEQVKNYLTLIKDHPEYINGTAVKEAGINYLRIGILVGVIIGAVGMYYIDHLGSNPETRMYGGRTEIGEPQEILKLLTQEADFENAGRIEKEMFTVEDDDWIVTQLGKEAVNRLQSTYIDMRLEGKLALQYNLREYCKMEIDHNTGMVYLEVNKPDVVITESRAEVMNKNREWIHLKTFDNAELELENNLKEQAINEAKNKPEFYEKAKTRTEHQLFNLLKNLKPYGVDIKGVKVKYIDQGNIPISRDDNRRRIEK